MTKNSNATKVFRSTKNKSRISEQINLTKLEEGMSYLATQPQWILCMQVNLNTCLKTKNENDTHHLGYFGKQKV